MNAIAEETNTFDNSGLYAEAIRRLGARCVDWLIVSFIGALFFTDLFHNFALLGSMLCQVAAFTIIPAMPFYAIYLTYCSHTHLFPVPVSFIPTADSLIWLPWPIECAYYVLMESSAKQATLGKILFGMRVVDAKGQRLSILHVFIRYAVKAAGAILVFSGPIEPSHDCIIRVGLGLLLVTCTYIPIVFTRQKQGLHDLIARTYVTKLKRSVNVEPGSREELHV